MRKVCLVTGGQLPVPDTKGGAVEHLITMIIDDNEQNPANEYFVICIRDVSSLSLQKNYKYTHFVNFNDEGSTCLHTVLDYTKRICRKVFHRPFYNIQWYERQVERYLLDNGGNFDLIINECAEAPIMHRVAKKWGKEKIGLHLHANVYGNALLDSCYGFTIGVSDYIRRQYARTSENNPDRNFLLMNGIDSDVFRQQIAEADILRLRESLEFTADDFIIIYCGRICKIKGILELMEAVASIDDSHVKLLILGASDFAKANKGAYVQEVNSFVNEHSDRIRFSGYIEHSLLYRYHQIADVAVVPSVYEDPCPLAMIEFVVSGLPTVATKSGGMCEIGDDETTIFIDKDERIVGEIRDAVLYLRNDAGRRNQMRDKAKARGKMFDKDTFVRNFNKIIATVCTDAKTVNSHSCL